MANIIYYILLCIIGVAISAFIIYKKRKTYPVSALILFCLFAAGISWIGEFAVLGLFNSYAYKTGVLADIWAQNLLGHMLLNASLYPAIALITVAYSINFYKIAFISAILTAIEFLFVKLGVYEHHWWKYYMTFIGGILYLSILRFWFPRMIQKRYGWTRFFTFYMAAMVMLHFPTPVLTLLGKEHFQMELVSRIFVDMYRSSIVVIFTYHLFVGSILLVLFVCMLKKWYWEIAPFIVTSLAMTIFYLTGVLVLEGGWNLVYSILINYVFIGLFILLERYALKEETEPQAAV
jgi:hypothetical protein